MGGDLREQVDQVLALGLAERREEGLRRAGEGGRRLPL
jgi:hypothetical protein